MVLEVHLFDNLSKPAFYGLMLYVLRILGISFQYMFKKMEFKYILYILSSFSLILYFVSALKVAKSGKTILI